MLQTIDMIIREVHIGLWFLVVGYYFFVFIFLLGFRWRKTRNPFQFAMAVFFLLLAIGRCFYFVGDFYADASSLYGGLPGLGITPFLSDPTPWLAAGAFFQWLALALLSATGAFMILGKLWAEALFSLPAIIIAIILGLNLVDAPVRSAITTYVGTGYALFIPLLFWYLAWQSGGLLRRSNFLLGLGFFILFAGRAIHSARNFLASYVFGTPADPRYAIPGVIPPGLIVIGLILIAIGNEWGQAK